ncbi:THAP domain-containing protein 11-like [Amblyomma americanum]
MDVGRARKATNRRYCCVKDCHSREGNGDVKLFRFPARPYESTRRLKWIVAVRLVNGEDFSNWSPNDNTRICSKHFVNGEKSTIETHPGYLPTIFPSVHRKRSRDSAGQLSRFNRWMQRSAVRATACPQEREAVACATDDGHSPTFGPAEQDTSGGEPWNGLDFLCAAAEIHSAVASVETQTDHESAGSGSFSVFICCSQGCDVSTQITHRETRDCGVQHKPAVTSTVSGPDHRTSYFAGYDSIEKPSGALEDLCSVNCVVFAL